MADRRRCRKRRSIKPQARGSLAARDRYRPTRIEQVTRGDGSGNVEGSKRDGETTLRLIGTTNLPTAKDRIHQPSRTGKQLLTFSKWECVQSTKSKPIRGILIGNHLRRRGVAGVQILSSLQPL